MKICPNCKEHTILRANNERVSSWGYDVKVITCSRCHAVLGTTLSDGMQEMIENIHREIRK